MKLRSSLSKYGEATSSLPKCKYFDKMAFLHEKVQIGLVKAIYSCNQISFHHLLHRFSQYFIDKKTNTVGQSSGLHCKKCKLEETEVQLMKQLSDVNGIKKLLAEIESE